MSVAAVLPFGKTTRTDLGSYLTSPFDGRLLEFRFGLPKIPYHILYTIIAEFSADLTKESILRVYYDKRAGEHYIERPDQLRASKTAVSYTFRHNRDILVLTVHSHNTMPAFFSETDDADELDSIGLFGVIGNLGGKGHVQMMFRACMQGTARTVYTAEIFGDSMAA